MKLIVQVKQTVYVDVEFDIRGECDQKRLEERARGLCKERVLENIDGKAIGATIKVNYVEDQRVVKSTLR